MAGVEVASPTFGIKLGNPEPVDPDRPLSLQELESQRAKLQASLKPESPAPTPSRPPAAQRQPATRPSDRKSPIAGDLQPQRSVATSREADGAGTEGPDSAGLRSETLETALNSPFKVQKPLTE